MITATKGKIRKMGLLMILIIIILIGVAQTLSEDQQQKLLYLSVEKPYYDIGEKITFIITAEPLAGYDLSIASESNLYRYSGELSNNIDYYPKEQGLHQVELTSKQTQKMVDSLNFTVSKQAEAGLADDYTAGVQETSIPELALADAGTASGIIRTDKPSYTIGETVTASVNAPSSDGYKFYYEYEGFTQRYMGDFAEIKFVPKGIGTHYLVLKDSQNNEIERLGFEVAENTSQEPEQIIGQKTTQTTSDQEIPIANISQPEEPINTLSENYQNILRLVSSKKMTERAIIKLYNSQNSEININDLNTTSNITRADQAEVMPENVLFKKIILRKLLINRSQNTSLGIDDVPASRILLGKKNVVKAFAVDASGLNFTNGTLTGTATGTELWKCKEWEFASQSCLGTWSKVMDLVPGQDYDVEISPGDPGYAETGVASVNSKKPIYQPGETADIIMVVLDTAGHLVSNAYVGLTIIMPDNKTTVLTTSNGAVNETSRGIYEASYTDTSYEGNYSLIISAVGDNVNSTMYSYFIVQSNYDYDIIRDTPVTTDPWLGPINSSIRITSHKSTISAIFNFTEVLPGSFEIINAEGAIVTTANNKTYLTWTGLSNNSVVSYSANPPLLTPELHQLGPSFVSYNNGTFYEARPWYLAVDPQGEDKMPDGDGAYTSWSITGGQPTRWQSVDDPVGSPDTTTYINTAAANRNSFTFQDLGESGILAVNWIAVTVNARRESGGVATLRIFYRQGGTDYDNANYQNLTTTWTTYSQAGWNYTTNPATGAAWNESSINNMEWGVYRSGGSVGVRVTQIYVTVNYNSSNLAPNVTALNYPGNRTNITGSSTISFNFTAKDDRGFDNCTLYTNATGSWQPNASITSVANNSANIINATMPDGNILWNVVCWDNATVSLSSTYIYNYTAHIDTQGPVTTLNSPANSSNISSSTYTLNATATDMTAVGTVTFQYRPNATATWTVACTNNTGISSTRTCTWNLAALPDGKTYEIRAYANDTFGTLGNNDTNTNITLDRTGPTTTINLPANFTNITTTTYTLNATATDMTAVSTVTFQYRPNATATWTVACTNNTGISSTRTCTWNLAALPDGKTYEIRAYANDTLGNIGSNDTHTNITLDRTGPTTTINLPANFTNITTTTYTLNATAADMTAVSTVTFQYRPNAASAWTTACTNNTAIGTTYACTWTLTGLSDSLTYEIIAYANDTLGNIGINDTHMNITVDLNGPTTTIDRPVNSTNITTNSYTVNATATDVTGVSAVTFLYRPNATATWTAICTNNTPSGSTYSCNWSLTSLIDGNTYEIRAYANDTRNHIGSNDTRYNISLNRNQAPTVTALNNPGNNTNVTASSTIQFNFTATDNTGFTNCTLYTNTTGSWQPNQSRTNIVNNSVNNITSTMPDGNLKWNVLCWDNATIPLSDWYDYNYTVHIDTTGPVTVLLDPDNRTNITTNTYGINAIVTDETGISALIIMYRQNASDTWHWACSDDRGPAYDYCDWDLSTLPDGHTYEVRAYANDTYGTTGNNDTHYNITIDRNGPAVALDRPSDSETIYGTGYLVNATATDADSIVDTVAFEYRENASTTWKSICNNNTPSGTVYSCYWSLAGLSEQSTYEIRARANDTLGNNASSTHTAITVTKAPDILDVSATPEYLGIGQTVIINATITDSNGISSARIIITNPSGENSTSYMSNVSGSIYQYTYNPFATGTYKFAIVANDTQGFESILDPYFYVIADADVFVLAQNNSYINDQYVSLRTGFVNLSSDQESGTQAITAQGWRNITFLANGSSFISFGEGYEVTSGSYTDTQTNNNVYLAVARLNSDGWGLTSDGLQAYINVTYNVSGIGVWPDRINSLVFKSSFCHSNDASAPIACASPMGGTANNPANFEAYNFISSAWSAGGTFTQNTTSSNKQNLTFSLASSVSNYVSNNIVYSRFEVDANRAAGEDAAFAIDHANLTVNYTRLDNEGKTDHVNYTGVGGSNMDYLTGFGVIITATYYNASGSLQAGNRLPDLEVTAYDGSSYVAVGNCSLNASMANVSTTPTNCTIVVTDKNIINVWKNNTASRIIQVRGINFDEENYAVDAINYTNIYIKYFSGSLITNNINHNLSGYLQMIVERNDSGSLSYVSTVANDSNGGTIRNITAFSVTELASIWNSNPFYTNSYEPGSYVASVSLRDANGSVLNNSDRTALTGSDSFVLDYIKISILSPQNLSVQDAEGFDANISLSYFNYPASNCYYSIDGGTNESMQSINSTFYHSTVSTITADNHSIRFSCNDTRGRWFSSQNYYFEAKDMRGPVVNLMIPANNSMAPNGSIIFYYNVSDQISGVQNCTIIIDYTARTNTSYNVAENTNQSFTVSGLTYENHVWQVECYDNSSNNNLGVSPLYRFLVGTDTTPPSINLLSPEASYNSTTSIVQFSYTVVDTQSDIANCSLIANGSVLQVNTTILTGEFAVNYFSQSFSAGNFNWSINCTDIRGNMGKSEWRKLTVINDTDAPIISLINPPDDYISTDGNVIFSYNVTEISSSISNCSLIFNNTRNQTNSTIQQGATQYFTLNNLPDNVQLNWSINCTDSSANHNVNSSEIRNLSISKVSSMKVRVTSDKSEYQTGESAQINTTVKNALNSNLAADVITDIIRGNATIGWWNTSWQRRKPISLSSTRNITNALIEVNVSGLSNNITSCSNEIRIIKNDSSGNLVSINRTVESGDNANYCIVRFRVNLTDGISNTNYYAYYNYSAAVNPNNDEAWLNKTSLRSAETGNLISAGAGYNVNDGTYADTASDNGVYYAVGRQNTGGWGGTEDDLQAYINLSYNLSGLDVEASNALFFNFTINFCHTSDVTAPITCNGAPASTPNNPASAELYNFNTGVWDSFSTFNQDGSSANEQTLNLSQRTSLSNYISNNKVLARYETDFALGTGESTSFALDYAFFNISYREKVYNNLTTIGSTQVFVDRQTQQSITSGLASFNFNTSSYTPGAHSAVSKANLTAYYTTFNYTFFNVIRDIYGPSITLVSPPNNNYSTTRNLTFIYTANDVGNNIANCSLVFSGEINATNYSISEGTNQYFYVNNMADGQYNWSINCTDMIGNQANSSIRNLTIGGDISPPVITLYKPENNTPFLNGSTVLFNFSATDSLSTLANCSLLLNGSIMNTTIYPASGAVLNFTVGNLANGNYTWNVNCTDNSSNKNVGTSEVRNFTIGPDNIAPIISLKLPARAGQVDNGNVNFTYNVTDQLSGISNCTIFAYNSSFSLKYNATNTSVQRSTNQYFRASNLSDGLYYWNITCWDNATAPNQGFSSTWNFTVASDSTPPVVHLRSPASGIQDLDGNVTFYFNVTEAITSIANCSLAFNGTINTTKNGTDITNNAENNFTLTNMGNGLYLWYVNCSDTAQLGSNIGKSETWNITVGPDVAGPAVTLWNPPQSAQNTEGVVTFEFSAYDALSNITNCSMVFNNTVNNTWSNVTANQHYNHTIYGIPNGNYTWYVNCTDDSIGRNIGKSEVRNFSVGSDQTPPAINLVSPANNTKSTNGNITFIYNTTDYASNVTSCSLIINDVVNQTNASITEGASQYFYLYNLSDTQFFWKINCTDDAPVPNTGSSQTRNLTVVIPKPLITDVITDSPSYVQGQAVQITANTTNSTGTLVNSNVTIDVVKGNAKAPWWNTNWKYRTPVEINTNNYQRDYYLVEQDINFTSILLNDLQVAGKTLDTNSVRVVEWEDDNDTVEIPSQFRQGPDFNASANAAGTVAWIMNTTLPPNTTKRYYIYFDTTDRSKSAPSYTKPTYTFVGTGQNVNYDGSTNSRNYLVISSGTNSFALQFADGNRLVNQQHIKYQGAGALWNISLNNHTITNPNSSIVPISLAVNHSFTTSSTSNVTSGPVTWVYIPGQINALSPSVANLTYTIWFTGTEIFVKANFTAYFGSSVTNIYAYENTEFSYLLNDDNNTGWTNYINRVESQSKNQTHTYHGIQDNTYNTFYASDWYIESGTSLGSIGLALDQFMVNSANATKGIVTFNDDNDGEETDMVGFSNNGNSGVSAGDIYNMVVWMVFTPDTTSSRITSLKDAIGNPLTQSVGQGEEFMNRSNGLTTGGFYYYNFSTAGRQVGNYSAISSARQTDFQNASAYTWFNITTDTIPPNVTLVRPSGWLSTGNVNFTFYIAEGGSGIFNCTLILNGAPNTTKTSSQLTDYANNTFNLTNMPEGDYNWTVLCYDNGTNSGTANALNITIDTTAPNVTINSPAPGSLLNDSTPLFNFTIRDNRADPINYTVYVNGAVNGQIGNASNNTQALLNLSSLGDGAYNISIRGTDMAGNYANATVQITVDTQPPTVRFVTANGLWFNYSTPTITFNISDIVDTNINFTIYVNGSFDQAGNVTRNTTIGVNLSSHSDGNYNVTIRASDDANNSANYSILITIDTQKPGVALNYPEQSANLTTTSVNLNFTATDNLDPSLTCNLTLDGSVNRSNFQAINGQETKTPITGLREATHYWNVACWDNASNLNISETRSFNVFIPPRVNLTAPPNGNASRQQSQTFYFNVSDDTGILNCSLMLNGGINSTKPGSLVINNATNNFTVTGLDGIYNWSVRCFDNTTMQMQGDSENWSITIDILAPYPAINTLNYTWFNGSSPLINFTIADDFDQLVNYTFYVNGSANTTGLARSNSSNTTSLHDLNSNSSFAIMLQATDDAGNTRNSTSIIIYVDTVQPNINLSRPDNGQEFNTNTVQFNFTATDNMAPYIFCNLSISNGMYERNINATNNVLQNITKSGLVSGTYYWNVSCVDLAGNRNTSVTWNFTILAPDLAITSGNITFNETSPEEGRNITIYANIYNIGGSPASNVKVQFWRGDPDAGGTQINGNLTIATLNNSQNTTVNVIYNVSIGTNSIYVVVDPPTATGGSITEENENNNKANASLDISLYQLYAGNTTELIDMEKQSINISLYTWTVSNATGSNIFVTNLAAAPDFNNLQAIGRNASNGTASTDFADIDTAFGSTSYSDSINNTYTQANAPKATRTFTIFRRIINNVPIVNSTNTSSFITGILWDMSDGNTEYNGTQDLLFNTEINEGKQGSRGTYDFEIKVPALLRNYRTAGTSVAFYFEIK